MKKLSFLWFTIFLVCGISIPLINSTASWLSAGNTINGTFIFPAGSSNYTRNLTTQYNLSSTLIFFQNSLDTSNINVGFMNANFTSNNSIKFNRSQTGNTINVLYYISTFNNGVVVQRGRTNFATRRTNIPLTTLTNISQCFPMATWTTSQFNINQHAFGLLRIKNTTGMEWESNSTAPTIPMINWQVPCIDGAVVQNGTTNLSIGSLNSTITLPFAVRNISQSFVYISGIALYNAKPVHNWSAIPIVNFTGNNKIRFDRNLSQMGVNISWYVVDIGGSSVVQFINTTIGKGTTTTNTVIPQAVNTSRSVAFSSGLFMTLGLSNETSQSGNLGRVAGLFNISTSTNLKTFRTSAVSQDTTDYRIYVIDWGNYNPPGAPASGISQFTVSILTQTAVQQIYSANITANSTFPGNQTANFTDITGDIYFNQTVAPTQFRVNAQANGAPSAQDGTNAIFRYCNTGTTTIAPLNVNITEVQLPSCISVNASLSFAGLTTNLSNTTLFQVSASLASGSCVDLWLFADFNNCLTPGGYNVTLQSQGT